MGWCPLKWEGSALTNNISVIRTSRVLWFVSKDVMLHIRSLQQTFIWLLLTDGYACVQLQVKKA